MAPPTVARGALYGAASEVAALLAQAARSSVSSGAAAAPTARHPDLGTPPDHVLARVRTRLQPPGAPA